MTQRKPIGCGGLLFVIFAGLIIVALLVKAGFMSIGVNPEWHW